MYLRRDIRLTLQANKLRTGASTQIPNTVIHQINNFVTPTWSFSSILW